MAVKLTYFVHGTTTDNKDKLATGWIPGELSEQGIEQSIVLKGQTNINDFDLVISSDLKRAVDSAILTFEGLKEIKNDSRIRECNYGDLNGKPADLVKYEEHIYTPFPNGESLKDVEKRVRDFSKYLLENYNGKHIAIVAHKAPQMAFQVITEHKTWEQAIDEDWRKTKSWQPGWLYTINEEDFIIQNKGPKDLITEQETSETESMTDGQFADHLAETEEY
jgi:broad specificity phosphatase PhoE